MVRLNCLSINKLNVLASILPNNTSSPSIHHHASPPKPSLPTINTARTPLTSQPPTPLPKLKRKRKQEQTSILKIERAIGAGSFRDREPNRDLEEKKSLFDTILSTKGPWRSGEWITDKTEGTFRSAESAS